MWVNEKNGSRIPELAISLKGFEQSLIPQCLALYWCRSVCSMCYEVWMSVPFKCYKWSFLHSSCNKYGQWNYSFIILIQFHDILHQWHSPLNQAVPTKVQNVPHVHIYDITLASCFINLEISKCHHWISTQQESHQPIRAVGTRRQMPFLNKYPISTASIVFTSSDTLAHGCIAAAHLGKLTIFLPWLRWKKEKPEPEESRWAIFIFVSKWIELKYWG